jgi:hypothetical protein
MKPILRRATNPFFPQNNVQVSIGGPGRMIIEKEAFEGPNGVRVCEAGR